MGRQENLRAALLASLLFISQLPDQKPSHPTSKDVAITLPLPSPTNQVEPIKSPFAKPETRTMEGELIRNYLWDKTGFERYTLWDNSAKTFVNHREELLTTDQTQQAARELIINGVYLLQLVLSPEKASDIQFDRSLTKVLFRGKELNLEDPLDFHVLASLVELELNNRLLEIRIQEQTDYFNNAPDKRYRIAFERNIQEFQRRQTKENRDVTILFWLYDERPPLVFYKDSFPIIPAQQLIYLGRFLKTIKEAGIPYPRKIIFVKNQPGMPGGGYFDHSNTPDPIAFTAMVTSHSNEITGVHEIMHFISDASYLDPNNEYLQQISLEEYQRQVKDAVDKHQDKIKDPNNIWIGGRPIPSVDHDYTEAMEFYYLLGTNFRERMASLREKDPGAYEVLAVKYKFMQNVFRGVEFIDGIAVKALHDIGEITDIVDPSISEPGIFVRQAPGGDIDPSSPAVFNKDRVKIIGGPVLAQDQFGYEKIFWQITIIDQTPTSRYLVGQLKGTEGWIPEEWLKGINAHD